MFSASLSNYFYANLRIKRKESHPQIMLEQFETHVNYKRTVNGAYQLRTLPTNSSKSPLIFPMRTRKTRPTKTGNRKRYSSRTRHIFQHLQPIMSNVRLPRSQKLFARIPHTRSNLQTRKPYNFAEILH